MTSILLLSFICRLTFVLTKCPFIPFYNSCSVVSFYPSSDWLLVLLFTWTLRQMIMVLFYWTERFYRFYGSYTDSYLFFLSTFFNLSPGGRSCFHSFTRRFCLPSFTQTEKASKGWTKRTRTGTRRRTRTRRQERQKRKDDLQAILFSPGSLSYSERTLSFLILFYVTHVGLPSLSHILCIFLSFSSFSKNNFLTTKSPPHVFNAFDVSLPLVGKTWRQIWKIWKKIL